MANQVGSKETVTLEDGTKVLVKSLPISLLRRFMEAWSHFGEAADETEAFDIFVHCSGIGLAKGLNKDVETIEEPYQKEIETKDEDGETKKETVTRMKLEDEYKTYLEENLDMDNIYKILDVCGGLKLNDPKLMEAAQRAAETAGQN